MATDRNFDFSKHDVIIPTSGSQNKWKTTYVTMAALELFFS
jgi:hypothetical protein